MVGNPHRYRAALHPLDNRHATAGCLLSMMLVAPALLFRCCWHPAWVLVALAVYCGLLVPWLAGYVSWSQLVRGFTAIVRQLLALLRRLPLQAEIAALLRAALQVSPGSLPGAVSASQLSFFLLAQGPMPSTHLRLQMALHLLLFGSVLNYLRKALTVRGWSQLPPTSTSSQEATDLVRMTSSTVVTRLGKGVACSAITFWLLARWQPEHHDVLGVPSLCASAAYFFLSSSSADAPSGPVSPSSGSPLWDLSRRLVMLVSCMVLLAISWTREAPSTLLLLTPSLLAAPVELFRRSFLVFRLRLPLPPSLLPSEAASEAPATPLCAICLDTMILKWCWLTPCGHMFHLDCLRTALIYYPRCPLCKTQLPSADP